MLNLLIIKAIGGLLSPYYLIVVSFTPFIIQKEQQKMQLFFLVKSRQKVTNLLPYFYQMHGFMSKHFIILTATLNHAHTVVEVDLLTLKELLMKTSNMHKSIKNETARAS